MELIFNNMDENVLIVDEKNIIQFCNKKLLEKLMYNIEDLKDFNISKLLGEDNKLNQNEILSFYNKKGKIINFATKIFDINWRCKTAKIFILHEHDNNIKQYSIEDLELVLDGIPLLVWIKDLDGKYIYVNQGYADKFSLTKDYIIGKKDIDFWVKEEAEKLYKEDQNLIKQKGYFINKELLRVNKSEMWLYVFKVAALDENENVKYVFGVAKDITGDKKIEAKRRIQEKEIEIENLRNEFFANISHEFKTPLNIILGTIQLLIKYNENDMIYEIGEDKLNYYMNTMKQNSYRLLRLVDNLIDITQIDTGYYDVNLENQDIVYIVEEVVTSVASYVEGKGISIIFDTNKEEKFICCDSDKIEKIILNLISNAIKYTHEDGKIEINIDVAEDNVYIYVKDNGIGISKEKISAIFERFVQIDKSLTRKQEGSGIGLSIVKELVEIQGGTIGVRSEEGKGTEFVITLPAKTIDYCPNKVSNKKNEINILEKCNIEFF
ncbi:PAS domain-containing sensor histidine kinase [[Clostridium] dakarense]|uniref:PAS domain-containing sensor histidine kinase n=1 Tax=Faecalimicrobium dakarense TaxID=1301100 RepID=UPI0004B9BA37|nr:PAS domain-containing sensor histidine kinase [[Clostridium] dakarense]